MTAVVTMTWPAGTQCLRITGDIGQGAGAYKRLLDRILAAFARDNPADIATRVS